MGITTRINGDDVMVSIHSVQSAVRFSGLQIVGATQTAQGHEMTVNLSDGDYDAYRELFGRTKDIKGPRNLMMGYEGNAFYFQEVGYDDRETYNLKNEKTSPIILQKLRALLLQLQRSIIQVPVVHDDASVASKFSQSGSSSKYQSYLDAFTRFLQMETKSTGENN